MDTLRPLRRSRRVLALFLAWLSATSLPAITADKRNDADFAFASGLESFYTGPQWFLSALPGSRRLHTRYLLDRAGDVEDLTPRDNGYVGTLREVFASGPFGRFGRTGPANISLPLGPLAVNALITWDGAGIASAWLTAANWSSDTVPGAADIATFATTAGSTAITINFSNPTNNGAANQIVGAIGLTGGESKTISSIGANGTLTLNGVGGVLLSNSSTFDLTLQNGSGTTMNVALANSGAIDVSSTGNITISSTLTGAGTGLTKTGNGRLTLSGNNTYTGTTTISAGTLEAAAGGALGGTTAVLVNGGTLLFSNNATTNRIADTSTMTLNGGTLNTAGLSEHGAMNNDAGLGALTLQSSSIIDLANGASVLAFADSSAQTWTGTLSIYNWSGTPITGDGSDQIYFGNSALGLTPIQLSQISFYSDSGLTFLGFGAWGAGLDGEVVPAAVPEPGTWIGAALALAAIGFTQRKRFAKRSRVIG